MPFITQGKTNWKFLLIVAVLAIFSALEIIIILIDYNSDLDSLSFSSEIINKKSDKRKVMDQQTYWDNLADNVDIGEIFNADYPTTKFLYSNPEKGISFYLPYNPKWGTEKYEILPYYTMPCPATAKMTYPDSSCIDGISFGPPSFFKTIDGKYSVDYMNEMSFLPARSSKEIIDYLNHHQWVNDYGVEKETIASDTINNISVVRYTVSSKGWGEDPIIEVVGKKYNYFFSCPNLFCGETDFKADEEEVIKTIKFID